MDDNVREFTQDTTPSAPAAEPQESFPAYERFSSRPAQDSRPARSAPRKKKKKKSRRTRLLQRRLIVLGVALAIFLIIFSLGSAWGGSRGAKLTQENVTAQLKSLADLSKVSYHYTNVERFENVEDFYGWDASDYSSGFTLSYSGVITASVDPAKATVEVKGKTVTITLPEAAVASNEITEDSLAVYNSNQGEFSTIEVTDFAGFKENQQPVAEAKATADGLLFDASDKAKAAAQSLIQALSGDSDKYEITVK